MSYGIDSDLIGFGDTTKAISLQSVTNPVRSPSEAKAMDSNGDVVAETLYDTTSGQQVTLNYVCGKDTSVLLYDTTTAVDFRGGKVVNGYVITGFTATTANNAHATISFNAQKTGSADSEVDKYTWGVSFNGGKGARKFGFSTDSLTKLTGSSITGSVGVARSLDSAGQELVVDVQEGRLDATHSLVGVTGAPGGSADTGWTLLNGPSKDESNTEYATGSASTFKNITADT